MIGAAVRGASLLLVLAAGTTLADERVSAREVVDGRTLVLADGRTVILAGIEVPESAGERRELSDAARFFLERLTKSRPATIKETAQFPDRHGRTVAQVEVDAVWAQGALISAGLARVRPTPLNRARTAEMLKLEAAARYEIRGVWKTSLWAVRDAGDTETLKRDVGTWRVVEGRVHGAEIRAGVAWIDLGDDWRTDTAIKIDKAAMRLFKREKIDVLPPVGTAVRVRGVVEDGTGPVIEIDLPEQIERLPVLADDR